MKDKIRTCFIYFSVLSLPINLTLSIVYANYIGVLLVFMMMCYAYLIAMICAKYSSFPDEMNLSKAILIVISLAFPPILFIFIPNFYFQSIKKLNTVLDDSH